MVVCRIPLGKKTSQLKAAGDERESDIQLKEEVWHKESPPSAPDWRRDREGEREKKTHFLSLEISVTKGIFLRNSIARVNISLWHRRWWVTFIEGGTHILHETISYAKFPKKEILLLWHGKSVLPPFTYANQKVIKDICVRARVCVYRDVFIEQKSHQHQQEWRRTKHQEAMKWMMTMSATGSTCFSSNRISLLTKQ